MTKRLPQGKQTGPRLTASLKAESLPSSFAENPAGVTNALHSSLPNVRGIEALILLFSFTVGPSLCLTVYLIICVSDYLSV